jgi:hypothetical protein
MSRERIYRHGFLSICRPGGHASGGKMVRNKGRKRVFIAGNGGRFLRPAALWARNRNKVPTETALRGGAKAERAGGLLHSMSQARNSAKILSAALLAAIALIADHYVSRWNEIKDGRRRV